LLARILIGIPFLVLLGISAWLSQSTYPIKSQAEVFNILNNNLKSGVQSSGSFSGPAATAIILKTIDFVQNMSLVSNVSGRNVTDASLVSLGPPLIFLVQRAETGCPADSTTFLSDIHNLSGLVNVSWVQTSVGNDSLPACYGESYKTCVAANCGTLQDARDGDLSVSVFNISNASISSSTATLGFVSLLYSPWNDAYSVIRFYMDFDVLQVASLDTYISTYQNLGNFSTRVILLCGIISGLQLLLDLTYFLKPVWFDTVTFLEGPWILYRVPPMLISLSSTLLFFIKYLSLLHVAWLPSSDWRSIEAAMISLNGNPSLESLLNAFSNLARQEKLQMTIRTLDILLLFAFLLRFILYLTFHPRLAMISETLRHGWDDFVHFALVFSSFLLGFAFLFCLAFGTNFYYASSYPRSLFIQFVFLMGTWDIPQTNSADEWLLVGGFFTIFGLIMFFTGLFFVLAFIQGAYGKYSEQVKRLGALIGTPLEDCRLAAARKLLSVFQYRKRQLGVPSFPIDEKERNINNTELLSAADVTPKSEYSKWKSRIIYRRRILREMAKCNRLLSHLAGRAP